MRSTTTRLGSIFHAQTRATILSIAGCLAFVAHASAQSSAAAPAPATYKGCVQRAPGTSGSLLISTPNACARLTGKVSGDDLVGHEVELSGVLTPRTPSVPASIQVDSVVNIGKACTNVCTLHPRGLRPPPDQPKATPGTEGGTPGAQLPPP